MYTLPSSGSEMLRSFNVNTGRNTIMAFQGNIAHQSKGGPERTEFYFKSQTAIDTALVLFI